MRTLGIMTAEELRQADHKAVIAWERYMRESEHAASSTIRRRLAALSSLYKHLVRHGHAARGHQAAQECCGLRARDCRLHADAHQAIRVIERLPRMA